MKIRITKEQARILESLNNKKVLKITEEQYKQILRLEGVDESVVIPQIRNGIAKLDPKMGKDYTDNVHQMQKIKGVLHEDLWKEFVNELYGLNESGKNIYEKLIKMMEACGYVENRKLSKTVFEGDKDLAKEVISSGLAKLHECGSPYMAMEEMENTFKTTKDSEIFKNKVDDWFAKGNEHPFVRRAYDDNNYWGAWQLTRKIGNIGKMKQNPSDMEVVSISEIDGESNENGVVGLDILNYEPFKSLPETRGESGDYTTRMDLRLPSLEIADATESIFSKKDFLDYEYQGPKMVHTHTGYITRFKQKFGEEPIFVNITGGGRKGSAEISNEKFLEWQGKGIESKKGWMDAERSAGRTSGLDEYEIEEVNAMGGAYPVFGGPGGFPVGKLKEVASDDVYDDIASELGLTNDEFDEALNNSMAELDIIERIYFSDSYTRREAMSIIADLLKLNKNTSIDEYNIYEALNTLKKK